MTTTQAVPESAIKVQPYAVMTLREALSNYGYDAHKVVCDTEVWYDCILVAFWDIEDYHMNEDGSLEFFQVKSNSWGGYNIKESHEESSFRLIPNGKDGMLIVIRE